jgi:WD40 repeat protein
MVFSSHYLGLGILLLLLGAVLGTASVAWCKPLPQARLVAELPMASDGISASEFSPDGRTLASCVWDKVILWEVATKQQRATLGPHGTYIYSVVFGPGGKSIATASDASRIIKVWNLGTQNVDLELRGHSAEVTRLAVAKHNRTLASAAGDGIVKLWDLAVGREIGSVSALAKNREFLIKALAFSPNGELLVVAGGDSKVPAWGEVEVWNVNSRQLQCTIKGFRNVVVYSAFSPDGKALVAGTAHEAIRFWDPTTGQLQRSGPRLTGSARVVAFSPDGSFLVAGGSLPEKQLGDNAGEIGFFEVATGKQLYCAKVAGSVHYLAFSPDSELMASCGRRETVGLWNVSALARGSRPQGDESPKQQKQHADGKLGFEVTPEMESNWRDLNSEDARIAYKAIWRLIGSPDKSALFLASRLSPVKPANPHQIDALIKDLDGQPFATRQKATQELIRFGDLAKAALCRALGEKRSEESRKRIQQLLDKLENGPPIQLRELRAVEVLEYIGTSEAERILAGLAAGAPEARLTREARATVLRLVGKRVPP